MCWIANHQTPWLTHLSVRIYLHLRSNRTSKMFQSACYCCLCFGAYCYQAITSTPASIFCSCLDNQITWWRHQIETFSAVQALYEGYPPVTGGSPHKKTVMQIFDIFFDLRLNKRLKIQSIRWWFETPSCSLWRHCNIPSKIKSFYTLQTHITMSFNRAVPFK